jgi:hypothetical protein
MVANIKRALMSLSSVAAGPQPRQRADALYPNASCVAKARTVVHELRQVGHDSNAAKCGQVARRDDTGSGWAYETGK